MPEHWKHDIDDLRAMASAVHACEPTSRRDAEIPRLTRLNARTAAQLLSGAVHLLVREHGLDAAQRACADLARSPAAWRTRFGSLPRGADGVVPPAIHTLATVARGFLALGGPGWEDALRAAVAFWSSESDPFVWQRVAAISGLHALPAA